MSASRKCLQAGSVCKLKKDVAVGGKRHHTNHSQNYGKTLDLVADEQGKLWRDGGGRVTAAMTEMETAIEIASFES